MKLMQQRLLWAQFNKFKGAICSFGEEEKDLHWLIGHLDCVGINKGQFVYLGQHHFIMFYFVYMWRTLPPFLASNSVPGTIFSHKQQLLYYLINILNIKTLS